MGWGWGILSRMSGAEDMQEVDLYLPDVVWKELVTNKLTVVLRRGGLVC